MLKSLLFSVAILAFLFSAAPAQDISEDFCNNIGTSLIQLLKPTKIYHQITFENACDFEYGLNNSNYESININVGKFKSAKESSKEFNEDLEMFLLNKKKDDKHISIDTQKTWDKIYFYKSAHHDNFLLLRKRNFCISILSTNYENMVNVERMFRKINFE